MFRILFWCGSKQLFTSVASWNTLYSTLTTFFFLHLPNFSLNFWCFWGGRIKENIMNTLFLIFNQHRFSVNNVRLVIVGRGGGREQMDSSYIKEESVTNKLIHSTSLTVYMFILLHPINVCGKYFTSGDIHFIWSINAINQ